MSIRRKANNACPGAGSCLYCSMPLFGAHEHDHFPIPERLGGEAVHCTCVNCHSLKDRTMIAADTAWLDPMMEVFQSLSPLGRILLAKLMVIGLELNTPTP